MVFLPWGLVLLPLRATQASQSLTRDLQTWVNHPPTLVLEEHNHPPSMVVLAAVRMCVALSVLLHAVVLGTTVGEDHRLYCIATPLLQQPCHINNQQESSLSPL